MQLSFGGAARHVVIRPLGHRGRTTMPCRAQVCFVVKWQVYALQVSIRRLQYLFVTTQIASTLLPRLRCGPRISYRPPALRMRVLYNSANATLHRLIVVAMFFSNQILVVVLYILPLSGGLSGLCLLLGVRWVRTLRFVQFMYAASNNMS